MRRWVAATAFTIVAVLGAGCGASTKKSNTSTTTNGNVSTTPTTVSGFAGGNARQGTITVTGGDQFTGTMNASSSEICSPRVSGDGSTFGLMLSYDAGGGKRRELDVNSASIGTTDLSRATKAEIRYSDYEENGGGAASDYYDWGEIAAVPGAGKAVATGTITITSQKSGGFTGDLSYAGDESRRYPRNYKGPVHVVATWNCP